GEVTLEPVALVTGRRDVVELAAINHQLGVDTEASQRLIHLFAAGDGNVEIFLASEKQRGRLDSIRMEEWIGDPDPDVLGFPRWTNLGIVLSRVLIEAIHRRLQRAAGAADGCFESRVGRDCVVGENSAIT